MELTLPRYQIGQRLRHPQFGEGLVVEVHTDRGREVLEVVFDGQLRRLSAHELEEKRVHTAREHAAEQDLRRKPEVGDEDERDADQVHDRAGADDEPEVLLEERPAAAEARADVERARARERRIHDRLRADGRRRRRHARGLRL